MKKLVSYFLLVVVILFTGCSQKGKKHGSANDPELIHNNVHLLTKMIVYDVFSPPVASRIYCYTSIAMFETMRFADPEKYHSIANRLNGFKNLPEPDKKLKYDFSLAASKAFFTVLRTMIFSVDSIAGYENNLYASYQESLDEEVYERSIQFGTQMGQAILKRTAVDNYKKSRGKPKFLGTNDPGKWRPTAPDYFDGVEYCWGEMMTFAIESSGQFPAENPPFYSEDTTSAFYRGCMEVYKVQATLTDDQKEIARFWDDNSFVMQHSGHMMFANKKITPGGHWIGITEIACKKVKADALRTLQAYTLTSIAVFDAFVCCWEEKYRSNLVRPVTFINEKIDEDWMPFLQTPPFPEYPSGHSTITMAAATVLTGLFGDNFSYTDTSEIRYIGLQRNFGSFIQAANEASISRFYGGIHYLPSLKEGSVQGKKVGDFIVAKFIK